MTDISNFARTVLKTIRYHGMIGNGEGILVGLSGGPDSVALLMALHNLSRSRTLSVQICTAHLNHGLRPDEADADAAFCRDLAGRLDIPHQEASVNLQKKQKPGESLEAAGRRVRYEFLARAASRFGVHKIATGHHADDQAETVLMRLLRGCGVRGLSAVVPSRPMSSNPELLLVRPILECRRSDVLNYLNQLGESYRVDSSNTDTDYRRNYVRHDLIPDMKSKGDGDITGDLCGVANLARDVFDAVERKVDRLWDDVCCDDHTAFPTLDVGKMVSLSAELRKALIRRATSKLPGQQGPADLSREHYEQAAGLPEESVGAAVSLPGEITVRREHGALHFEKNGAVGVTWEKTLPLPGRVSLPSGFAISAALREIPGVNVDELVRRSDDRNVYLSRDRVSRPLCVRNRRPGDIFHPLRAPGHKKLKDFLIDRRIPRHLRDGIPIVLDSSERLLWVAGYEICHHARLRPDSRRAVLLHVGE